MISPDGEVTAVRRALNELAPPSSSHLLSQIKHTQPPFQHRVYQECGGVSLISGGARCTMNPREKERVPTSLLVSHCPKLGLSQTPRTKFSHQSVCWSHRCLVARGSGSAFQKLDCHVDGKFCRAVSGPCLPISQAVFAGLGTRFAAVYQTVLVRSTPSVLVGASRRWWGAISGWGEGELIPSMVLPGRRRDDSDTLGVERILDGRSALHTLSGTRRTHSRISAPINPRS